MRGLKVADWEKVCERVATQTAGAHCCSTCFSPIRKERDWIGGVPLREQRTNNLGAVIAVQLFAEAGAGRFLEH